MPEAGQTVGIPEENIAVIENGQIIEFRWQNARAAERIPSPYVFVDGSGVGDVDPDVMREREALARDGVVMVNLTLDRSGHGLAPIPEIVTHGFILPREATGNRCSW
jgi:ribonuclease J